MKSRLVNKKNTFQARVDIGWQPILLSLRANTGEPIKSLIEHALSNTYGIDKDGKPYEIK